MFDPFFPSAFALDAASLAAPALFDETSPPQEISRFDIRSALISIASLSKRVRAIIKAASISSVFQFKIDLLFEIFPAVVVERLPPVGQYQYMLPPEVYAF